MANAANQQPFQALLAEYLSDEEEDPGPPNSLPPPPVDAIYSSEKEAMDAINEFTKQHGYALTTKSSKRHGDGQIKARYLHCNRSGVYKNNIADDKRVREKTTRRSARTLYNPYILPQSPPYLTMTSTHSVREVQGQSSQPAVADLASNKSTANPLSTGQTSEAPSKGLTAPASDQSSSLKNYEDFRLSDAERAQDLAGIGSWADSTPDLLERISGAEDMLNACV
ncbi:uncharacterized protein ASPGLDRAFT_54791 [Aspergillus glaucus CBS 516.65]|uniref:FAR1 domain-containing protein n=1 Tax=Aspergillus glaucus CBS 516.65 TaxID=1160497 RepID=A0A1L9VY22_ASPGL|nr:hypothetical protein ASPGLDRAFT_54791 [Aspergillus glaucus CBS 516.65]OJJ88811.1 hypothetical protein ASPGLDRAFT_54791 [Aspergillus glaucus CBS 516.65]